MASITAGTPTSTLPCIGFRPMEEQLGLHQPFWVRFLSCFCKHVHLSLCYLLWGMMIGCKVACDGKERESEKVDEGEGRWGGWG